MKKGEGGVWNFLLLCVHYISLMLFNIELLRKRNIFRGEGEGRKAGVWVGINKSLGLGEIPGLPPLNETLV